MAPKQAIFNVAMDIPERKVTAFIGPSGCGKSTLLRNLNRMNDLIDGVRHEGDILLDGQSLYDPSVEVISLRKRVGMVFQKSNPFPKSIYENVVFSLRVAGRNKRAELDEVVETSLRQRGPLGRGEGPPARKRLRLVRRPDAAALHRARHRQPPADPADGRALLRARSHRHAENRGADVAAQGGIHHRHRDPQHAAGAPHRG